MPPPAAPTRSLEESTVIHPLEKEPGTGDGSAVVIAPGVLWLRMPLYTALPWINVWAIAEQGGWSIVDTGLHSDRTKEAWTAAFAGALEGAPVVRVIATHMHPDHCGMAGWIAERHRTRLWMSRLEYLTCCLMAADTGRPAPNEAVQFYRSAGWDERAIEKYKAKFGFFGGMIYPMPHSYRRISDGETLRMGAHAWQVLVGNGHSPEHACLYCAELKLLISGDQVLPKISSNVSVFPTEPDANPLDDWMTSLAKIAARVPDDVLVLPAHKGPFRGLHARIGELIESHQRGLRSLEHLLEEKKRAVDVFPALFSRPILPELLGMATGEAIAHLNYLTTHGRAVREQDADGVWWWRRTILRTT
jgi:glyoxylase-like metal-dependent hydrolase (beta-lactamase superfamily II)